MVRRGGEWLFELVEGQCLVAVMRYAVLMKRTTIMLPDGLDARLRLEARRRGTSIADIAREAIEQHVPGPTAAGRLGFFAVGEGEPPDASERVDELVGEAIGHHHPRGSSA
ncbi:MAG: ribbon-helix-helix protein, CopG family [Actinomycetota bacterium]